MSRDAFLPDSEALTLEQWQQVERPTPPDATYTNLIAEHARQAPWRTRAACRDENVNPDWFFPQGRKVRHVDYTPARQVCARCPVTDDCLAYALSDPSLVGMWAGTTPRGRERLRRERAA